MKKIASIILLNLSLIFGSAAFAYDNAHVSVKITGDVKNTYYLCVNSNGGCMKINAKGVKFPITATKIDYIFLANIKNMRMYPQSLPSSCQVNITSKNNVVISGKMIINNDDVKLNNLSCSIS